MKFVLGGYQGTRIPRILNPLVLLGCAVAAIVGAIFITIAALVCIVLSPLSFILTIRAIE